MAIVKRDGEFVTQLRFRPWSDSNFNRDEQPVVAVSRDDGQEFCRWAGKRLPTEAEWEKAARGGLNGQQFSWGDDWPPPAGAGNFAEVSFKTVYTEDRFGAFGSVSSWRNDGGGVITVSASACLRFCACSASACDRTPRQSR